MKDLQIKKHIMTGISYMIPVVVAGGLLMAIARIFGGAFVGDAEGTIPWMINLLGSSAMKFVVPVLTAGIAYSIAERPGIAPGLVLGWISTEIKAGFLGGMLMGLIVGFFILKFKKLNPPKSIKSLMPVMIIPLVSTFVVGMLYLLLLANPIIAIQTGITNWMSGLQDGSRFVFGAVIGAMMGFDMGGPVNKTASAFSNALNAEGIFGPSAAKIIGGMTPPLGIGLAALLARKKFNQNEKELAKAAVPMGLSFITEGVLPFAAADPLRVIFSTMVGSAVAGGLVMMWGVESMAVHGGIFVVPAMENPLYFIIALVIGTVVTGVLYAVLKRESSDEMKEEEIEDVDININIQ
ncbi:MAG TPA: PTS fructose transporter subunit IIC [Clostridiaceae bacterium]|nr:PTS fructose transporter subunit IIC [Clostridiaceae bacterium]